MQYKDSTTESEFELLKLQKAIRRKVDEPPRQTNQVEPPKLEETPMKSDSLATPTAETKKSAATLVELGSAPVVEWPGRSQSTKEDEGSGPNDGQYDVCECLTLHRKGCNTSPGQYGVKIAPSETVDNPSDVRKGCNITMWDPAGIYNHLCWDPYSSTVVSINLLFDKSIYNVSAVEKLISHHSFCFLGSVSFVESTKTTTKLLFVMSVTVAFTPTAFVQLW